MIRLTMKLQTSGFLYTSIYLCTYRASIPPQSLSMNLESLTRLVASAVRYRVLHWTLGMYISGRQNLHWRLSGSCVGLREENIEEPGWSEKSLKFIHYKYLMCLLNNHLYNKIDITVSGNLNKCIQGKLKKHTVQLPLFLPLIITINVKI